MSRIHYLAVGAAIVATAPCYATVYHSVESAQKACFPEATEFTIADVKQSNGVIHVIDHVLLPAS